MLNQEIAKIFYQIAQYLEIEGVAFKPQAYEKVAMNLEILSENISDIYRKGGLGALEQIPGIGKSIAEKIEEYMKTGKIKEYEKLKKKIPVNIEELTAVEGIGPKKIKILYQKLKIKNLKDLEKAAKARKIAPLFGFGEKTGIDDLVTWANRFHLGAVTGIDIPGEAAGFVPDSAWKEKTKNEP